jgi:hypothetical protein
MVCSPQKLVQLDGSNEAAGPVGDGLSLDMSLGTAK